MKISSGQIHNMMEQTDSEIKEFIGNAKAGCVCYGDSLMIQGALAELLEDGFRVRYIIDDTPEKQGRIVDGIEVVSRLDEKVRSEKYIIGTSSSVKTMRDSLEIDRGGAKQVCFLPFCKYSVWKHYDECVYVRDNLLEDERSVEIYNLAMYAQMTDYHNMDLTGYGEGNQYFAIPEFDLLMGEHFIDVGAFVGDTLDEFVRHSQLFEKYIGFEPDEKHIRAIEVRKKRLCAEWNLPDTVIEIVRAGVGEYNTKAKLSDGYSGSSTRMICDESGDAGIDIVKLDDYLAGQKVTFMKADIEGMEAQALKGAREIIKNQKPKMAICIYHLPWDIYKIPMLVKELNCEYKFKIRLHSKGYQELVLYCY